MTGQDAVILHHYPQSPVSEKVRCVLGMKGLHWHSVEIPRLPPKPDVIELTGGYRMTPLLQIGADIYCDSLCIINELETRFPVPTLFPGGNRGLTWGLSRWTDGECFKTVVALVFGDAGHDLPDDFSKDRGKLYFGDAYDLESLIENLDQTEMQMRAQLNWIERELKYGPDFLSGFRPGLKDALCYYLIWFIRGRYSKGPELLAEFPTVCGWEKEIQRIGHGVVDDMSSDDAIAIAASLDPSGKGGEEVVVWPEAQPSSASRGMLVEADARRIVIRHQGDRAGAVNVHFPRLGYRLKKI